MARPRCEVAPSACSRSGVAPTRVANAYRRRSQGRVRRRGRASRHPVSRAGALPYGEQRLVELAVALAARPRLLLLDEPAAGMTGAEKERLVALIRKGRGGDVTVLVVEHDMRLVMGLSETVIVLNHGRVIAEGVPAEIRAHPEVVRAYLGSADAPA